MEKQENTSASSDEKREKDIIDFANALKNELKNECTDYSSLQQRQEQNENIHGGQTGNAHEVCFYHPFNQAVAQCDICKEALCRECAQDGQITVNGTAKKAHVCYNCSEKMVMKNMADLQEKKKKAVRQLIVLVIGMLAGLMIGRHFSRNLFRYSGIARFIFDILFMCTGGVLLGSPKELVHNMSITMLSQHGSSSFIKKAVLFLECVILGFGKSLLSVITVTLECLEQIGSIPHKIRENSMAQEKIKNYIQELEKTDNMESLREKRTEYNQVVNQVVEESRKIGL